MKRDQATQQLADLRAKHPDWYIWYRSLGRRGLRWYAGRPANLVATYEAQSADELRRDLSEAPVFLP